ncbi:MAG: 5-histidylcysteine sulfoxide synthase [Dysgonamonadaceae bacterium]|nr:5-histidylcysteine sulfoxide synthase [Dysgonamonadaceae bacterium]MDD3356693.1 5-histidylcysteine sulfoxide synthase [Dysgonamonadaceae bacterium]MDD3727066.1 5-histidylcysteine sulfoxide synthase [Dysgonamonadaceae bacterium]MDD4245953.1 5-histidylcysteine sulfoxide synthase [Dysgonamonadaceae bacterium]MDD4606432.1 5-histidylcysteine sulfoxide synthase [Dysgonamonadaceae bacterium]
MKSFIAKTINLNDGTSEEKRKEIRDYFIKTWNVHEKLYTQLASDEVFYHRGDPLRHIILFYLGHTAVFFINKLFLAKLIDARINPEFESTFAIGVDEMSWDDLDSKHYNWPEVDAVRDYREKAKEMILNLIDDTPLRLPIDWDNPFWIVMMGIEHERIHLETSSVLIRQLPLDEVVAGRFGEICTESGEAPSNEMLTVEAGNVKMGKPRNHHLYGWDNEYGKHSEEILEFKAAKYLTSNQEFLEFMKDDGYENEEFWTEEGWSWRNFKEAKMPLFWRKDGDEYRLRLVAEEIPMPWNWPVEVNYLEAKAFCNWKTKKTRKTYRLPTEAEWMRLYEYTELKDQLEWGDTAPGNINLEHFASPCPVDKFEQGKGFFDVIGNVWQWTETPITGFAGFKVHPMYDDFSTPTFDGKHNLIKGGSWISTGNEATKHSRYAFRRHFYQHAGFRMIESETPLTIESADYETDYEIAVSCEENWGDKFTLNPSFFKELSIIVLSLLKDEPVKTLLDLNADTGRLAFELAPYFEKITALDFSARYIRIPIQLQEQGYMRYVMKDEGELVFYRDVVLSDFALGKNKGNITFKQDNAQNLKPIYKDYDVIVAPNLLEELNDPKDFLANIHTRLNKNGYLIIASTYDWKDEAKENWPGGFKKDGEPVTSLDGIKQILEQNFVLERDPINLNADIKLSSRLRISRMSEITFWKKK